MNTFLIRLLALIILVSPWIYVSLTYKAVFYFFAGFIILLATVDIGKKKRGTEEKKSEQKA